MMSATRAVVVLLVLLGVMMPLGAAAPADRTAQSLRELMDILHGTNGVKQIAPGQVVELAEGDYTQEDVGIGGPRFAPGYWRISGVHFAEPVTVRAAKRRYNGYGADGGLAEGGAIFKKLWIQDASGIIFDGFAVHRGNIGQWSLEPGVHFESAHHLTFRFMEFLGFVPDGDEAQWRAAKYGDEANTQWGQQPHGIRRHRGETHHIVVEDCLFHYLGVGVQFDFTPDSAVRRSVFEYISGDHVKFECSDRSVFEHNIIWKGWPTYNVRNDLGHLDGFQATSKVRDATRGTIIRENIIMDRGKGKIQGIFAEQDGGEFEGPRDLVIEGNILLIPTWRLGAAIGIGPSGGGNLIEGNTVLLDVHGSSEGTVNVMIDLNNKRGKNAGKMMPGDVVRRNLAHRMAATAETVEQNVTLRHEQYGEALVEYESEAAPFEKLVENGVFRPAALRRLAWRPGHAMTDPNLNGGVGAWRTFVKFGAAPEGWEPSEALLGEEAAHAASR